MWVPTRCSPLPRPVWPAFSSPGRADRCPLCLGLRVRSCRRRSACCCTRESVRSVALRQGPFSVTGLVRIQDSPFLKGAWRRLSCRLGPRCCTGRTAELCTRVGEFAIKSGEGGLLPLWSAAAGPSGRLSRSRRPPARRPVPPNIVCPGHSMAASTFPTKNSPTSSCAARRQTAEPALLPLWHHAPAAVEQPAPGRRVERVELHCPGRRPRTRGTHFSHRHYARRSPACSP